MVFARWDGVGPATHMRVIEAPGHQALLCPEVPGSRGKATVTAIPTLVATTGEHVLSGHLHIDTPVAADADPVRDGFHSPKRPAGATGALVSDLFDGRAVGPLFPGIEAFGQDHVRSKSSSLGQLGSTQEGATELLHVAQVHIVEIVSGRPRSVLLVNKIDQLIRQRLEMQTLPGTGQQHQAAEGGQEPPHFWQVDPRFTALRRRRRGPRSAASERSGRF